MLIPVMIEPAFRQSHWCRQVINGILGEAKRKKYTIRFLNDGQQSAMDDPVLFGRAPRLVIVVGTSISWIPNMLRSLENHGIQAILINYDSFAPYASHSVVCMDYVKAMRQVMGYYYHYRRYHIACFGLNPNSSADRIKENYFLAALASRGDTNPAAHVFHNHADISVCFQGFLHHAAQYDALICANDIVAIAAAQLFQASGVRVPEDMFIVGFGESILSDKTTPSITTVHLDHEKMGGQAVMLFAYINKQSLHLTASVRVESQLIVRDSTNNLPFSPDMMPQTVSEPVDSVDFYQDPEIKRLQTLEDFYYHADELDQQILELLQKSISLESIAEQCSASVSTIGYRIRNMQSRLCISSRHELLRWLGKQEK